MTDMPIRTCGMLSISSWISDPVSGARGGFRLGRPAHNISIRAVYESIEGRLSLIECVDRREGFCCFAPVCTQIDIWSSAQHMLGSYLENISIGDIADRHGLVPRLQEKAPESLGALAGKFTPAASTSKVA